MQLKDKALTVIGMMSGTSFDGIDAAIVTTDGQTVSSTGKALFRPYADDLRQSIRTLLHGKLDVQELVEVENLLSREHASVALELLEQAKLTSADIDLIGFHGHTLYHNPHMGHTMQTGNPSLLAELTGIDVIFDFRRRDVAAGGSGAPLVPLFHQALFKEADKPLVVLNIGGVANITYLGKTGEIVAGDCGPGCALIDDFMHHALKQKFDDGGNFARTGKVDAQILKQMMQHEFFTQKPPKSLDRNAFAGIQDQLSHLSPQDAIATLTHITAAGIHSICKFLPEVPKTWVVGGGGRHNKFLLEILRNSYGIETTPVDNGDFLEAQAFGFLAVRSYYNLPLSVPTTTGVSRPVSGGALYRA
jgi:anhydro-N-acetylmuramic acid kinase